MVQTRYECQHDTRKDGLILNGGASYWGSGHGSTVHTRNYADLGPEELDGPVSSKEQNAS
jgi:hypothetical protein